MQSKSKGISLDWMADYYDLITFAERSQFRRRQIELMELRKGDRVIEIGCGTGVLSILSKIFLGKDGDVIGLDISPRMIKNAKKKSDSLGLNIDFITASADEIPYPNSSFDLVISSLMFHHLPVQIKGAAFQEILRILKPGGRLFLCDFGKPRWYFYPISFLMLIWSPHTRYHLFDRLSPQIRNSGFAQVELKKKGLLLDYYMARK